MLATVGCGLTVAPASKQLVEVGAADPDATAGMQRREIPRIDPIFQHAREAHPGLPRTALSRPG
jgi:hypothetical protein